MINEEAILDVATKTKGEFISKLYEFQRIVDDLKLEDVKKNGVRSKREFLKRCKKNPDAYCFAFKALLSIQLATLHIDGLIDELKKININ